MWAIIAAFAMVAIVGWLVTSTFKGASQGDADASVYIN